MQAVGTGRMNHDMEPENIDSDTDSAAPARSSSPILSNRGGGADERSSSKSRLSSRLKSALSDSSDKENDAEPKAEQQAKWGH